ncbi:hypothetical protein L596_021354 [Steinernema carpocapsae]|uniref:Uncharacterized protein n=1 Tax=Steinernema carpocapsae TaxID=34508 RepID=A0A4V6XVW2_STECR|nr:hypothetical protein L596_021354 [Steinernema carpocapsae]
MRLFKPLFQIGLFHPISYNLVKRTKSDSDFNLTSDYKRTDQRLHCRYFKIRGYVLRPRTCYQKAFHSIVLFNLIFQKQRTFVSAKMQV